MTDKKDTVEDAILEVLENGIIEIHDLKEKATKINFVVYKSKRQMRYIVICLCCYYKRIAGYYEDTRALPAARA